MNFTDIYRSEKLRALLMQFIKFGVVGFINTFLNLLIYYVLVLVHVNYIIANAIAFVLTVLNSYYWNNRYVFGGKKSGAIFSILKVYASYGVTFLISTVLLYAMVSIAGISEMVAPLINLFITVPLNFILNRFWVFK